jgi:glutamate synthase domain-containing protein 2
MRRLFLGAVLMVVVLNGLAVVFYPPLLWSMVVFGPLILLGLYDFFQTRHAVLRNFPLLGHFRYLFESIRPEIYQYFIESDNSGVPFSREQRTVVYQRAKKVRDTVPFGTLKDMYAVGHEWVTHSLQPRHVDSSDMRLSVGGPQCTQPYSSSILNISAMSFGSLSKNAVLALNQGAKMGNFAHNTGEGGISPYHLRGGGDLIWQIGTGYFGCRTHEGRFCRDTFTKRATLPDVKMIEIKLSQGAKPAHGGILPAAKLTKEIAEIRDVPMGEDVLSPPAHSAFSTPIELLEFVAGLRELSGGKPVGFKLCLGRRREFIAICKAMVQTGITPDFITVDGAEGGTGAAPLEFTNRVGAPLIESLIVVHNALVGFAVRDRILLIAGGKVTSGFGIVKRLALGADMCNSARAMMMALGCIQALKCNSNRCPTGVTTQDPQLMAGLVVSDKNRRVANFHEQTLRSVAEIIGAMGLEGTADLRPWHVLRRTGPNEIKNYSEIFDYLGVGDLVGENVPAAWGRACAMACAESFENINAMSDAGQSIEARIV